MEQILFIKKTAIDQDLKVTVTLEFTANNPPAQSNLFELIRLQGLPALIKVTPQEIQPELFPESAEKECSTRQKELPGIIDVTPEYEEEPPQRA